MDDLVETSWFRGDEACSFDASWSPAINVFRTPSELHVCLDLAGVDPTTIEIAVADGRVSIRGERRCPQPASASGREARIETMEIDYGPFHRVIEVGLRMKVTGMRRVYDHGLLHVVLPLIRQPGVEIKPTDPPASE
ncbi:MAG: Hsp20/alpha crystallin family protein [Phycisphaeraceae bacterium]